MEKKHLQLLIKAWRRSGAKDRERIEAYVGQHATDKQKTHFLDQITGPSK